MKHKVSDQAHMSKAPLCNEAKPRGMQAPMAKPTPPPLLHDMPTKSKK